MHTEHAKSSIDTRPDSRDAEHKPSAALRPQGSIVRFTLLADRAKRDAASALISFFATNLLDGRGFQTVGKAGGLLFRTDSQRLHFAVEVAALQPE